MKRWMALTGIVLLGVAAIVTSEMRKVEVAPGPAAVLYLVADTEQELMRLPVHFDRIDDAGEVAIGNELAEAYGTRTEQNKPASVQTVEKYLTQVGSRMAAHAHRKLPYKFHYVPEKFLVNAFALPGGHVYVGQGLLEMMDSEDELASVIGHEIEHIDHYHCVERMQVERALRKIPFGEIASVPIAVFQAGYSKDQEMEADREGTRLAVTAGYSANGAIRLFERFQKLEEDSRRRGRDPGEEVNVVLHDTLEGYFRSHPLPAERIAQIQGLIASNHWLLVAERDLEVGYIFLSLRARELFDQHNYPEAQAVAMRSLKAEPNQLDALDTLAKAYFSQGDFVDSAAIYRRILQADNSQVEYVKFYAIALAAADGRTAVEEFERSFRGDAPALVNLPTILPGLRLLAGNPGPAASLEEAMYREKEKTPADQFGDLGWWYYLAEDYPQSLKLLEEAVQQHPGEMRWLTDRAWVQIQNKRLGDALQSLNEVYAASGPAPDAKMARSVAFWLSDQKDAALREFQQAVVEQPEWKNQKWVRALYSPLVAGTVQAIQAEQERLRKLQQAKLND